MTHGSAAHDDVSMTVNLHVSSKQQQTNQKRASLEPALGRSSWAHLGIQNSGRCSAGTRNSSAVTLTTRTNLGISISIESLSSRKSETREVD